MLSVNEYNFSTDMFRVYYVFRSKSNKVFYRIWISIMIRSVQLGYYKGGDCKRSFCFFCNGGTRMKTKKECFFFLLIPCNCFRCIKLFARMMFWYSSIEDDCQKNSYRCIKPFVFYSCINLLATIYILAVVHNTYIQCTCIRLYFMLSHPLFFMLFRMYH